MSMKYIDTYDMEYKDEQIKIILHYIGDEDERIEFDYKGHRVYMFYKNKYNWYNMAGMVCRIVDKSGIEGFEKYKQYEEDIRYLMLDHIIVGDNVYKPDVNMIPLGNLKHYMMLIKMIDGTMLDGNPLYELPYSKIEDKDQYSRRKTFENLVGKVTNYYKSNNVLPLDKYLVEDKTKKYQEIQRWFKENEIHSINI